MGNNNLLVRQTELLEENYFMLKCLMKCQDIAHEIRESLDTLENSLSMVEKHIEVFGDASDLFESSQILIGSLKDAADVLVEAYRVLGHDDEASAETGEED
jgi:hypothetical protein